MELHPAASCKASHLQYVRLHVVSGASVAADLYLREGAWYVVTAFSQHIRMFGYPTDRPPYQTSSSLQGLFEFLNQYRQIRLREV